MIKIVEDKNDAKRCDELLTKLILDERKYNGNIDENYKVVDYYENVIENKNNILIAYYDEDNNNFIAGYVFLKQTNDDILKGYMFDALYVENSYRNKGIAKSLLSYANDLLKDKDISFLDINVMYDNIVARKLYKYFGFSDFRLTMRKEIKK